MREIKFRVYDKDYKKIHICGEDVHDSITFLDHQAYYYNLQNGEGSIEGGSYELMQYTGLKDKNGVEIYEGDVVPLTTKEETSHEWVENVSKNYVIKFISGGFALHKDGVVPYGSWYWLHDKVHMVEVIGNIYENPELIGGDQHGQTR